MPSAAVKSAFFPVLEDEGQDVAQTVSWLAQPHAVVRPAFASVEQPLAGADAGADNIAGNAHDTAHIHVDSARNEAELARQQAAAFERELAERRAAAEAEGRAAGEAAGRAAYDEASGRLARAIDDLCAARAALADDLGGTVVELALAVASTIVGRELDSDRDYALRLAQEALSLVLDEGEIELRVAPTDVAIFEANADRLAEAAPRCALRVVADNSVDAGCIVVGQRGRVDARVSARLRSVASALGAAAQEQL